MPARWTLRRTAIVALRLGALACLASVLVGISTLSIARAQDGSLPSSSSTTAVGSVPTSGLSAGDVASVLERGRQLERERRWADALTYYEDAIRTHPTHRELSDRLALAKAHFDVSRRYSDTSFVTSLSNSKQRETLDTYAEVLSKIQSHYVQPPQWHDLVRQGTFHWEVALTEPLFLRKHVPNVSADLINACRREVRQITDTRAPRSRTEARDLVAWVAKLAQDRIGLPSSASILEYTCGAMNSLDDYSGFLTSDQLEDIFSQIEGNFVGLGVELKSDDRGLLIVSVIRGSPADKGGLRGGEHIVGVDGQPTTGKSTDAAADMLKGAEGTTVVVDVMDSNGNTRSVRLHRERVDVPSVDEIKMVDAEGGVGYFKLTSFQKTTSRDVDAALWKLHQQGMRHLIIDVRGNPGGLLTAAVEVADKFVGEGLLVMTRGRSANEDHDYRANTSGTWRVPLVVLIDGESASASEIFAGAIRDHRRGKIVGTRSYGKGSVQGIFPLTSSSAGVRLTTAKFYSPSGLEINKRGVSPDVTIRTTAKPVGSEISIAEQGLDDDATLRAAIQVARESANSP
ncbi:MAG: S41 family peptidase [Pirellulales bacterium]